MSMGMSEDKEAEGLGASASESCWVMVDEVSAVTVDSPVVEGMRLRASVACLRVSSSTDELFPDQRLEYGTGVVEETG